MSPRLFAFYIDGLSSLLSKSNVGCYINDICSNHMFYADDICILAPSAMGLQTLIDICVAYGIDHDIIYNPLKTKCVAILPQGYKLSIPTVSLNGNVLEYVPTMKYLGVHITNNLTDDEDIKL